MPSRSPNDTLRWLPLNPLTVERQFQSLQQALPLIAGRRTKLDRFLEFFEPLLEPLHRDEIRSYGPELVHPFLREITSLNLESTPLTFARRLRRLLQTLQQNLPNGADAEEWYTAKSALDEAEARARATLARKDEPDDLSSLHGDPQSGPPADAAQPAGGIAIPVVEREFLLRAVSPRFASVRRVRVEMHFSRHDTGEDEILVDQAFDSDGMQHRQVRQALTVAREMAAELSGMRDERRIIVHCSFDEPNTIVGESLGAALTFAVFSELLRLYRYRETVMIRPDVAITGVCDGSGNLHPVDELGLRLKVEGCAYSSIRYLAVPRDQEEVARKALEDLPTEDERRPMLTIVGISTIKDLLYDRRMAVLRKTPLAVYVVERMWRSGRLLLVALLLPLLAIAFRVWYGPIDRSPERLEFTNESVLVLNRYGETLSKIGIGATVVAKNKESNDLGRSSRLVALSDVNRDGEREVVSACEYRDEMGVGTDVCCWRAASGERIWSHRLVRRLWFPDLPDSADTRFQVHALVVGDLTGDGVPEVAVIANHSTRFPAIVAILRSSDGAEISTYLHAGWLTDIALVRLGRDSIPKLAICGINNGFRSACLAVLDPRVIGGDSPLAPPSLSQYRPAVYTAGSEKFYLLLPRTSVGEAFRDQDYANISLSLGVNGGGSIIVSVRDFKGIQAGQEVAGSLTCTFGSDLELQSIEPSEIFRFLAETLTRNGRIAPTTDSTLFESYKKHMQYWNGTTWSDRPVMNQVYLQAASDFSAR